MNWSNFLSYSVVWLYVSIVFSLLFNIMLGPAYTRIKYWLFGLFAIALALFVCAELCYFLSLIFHQLGLIWLWAAKSQGWIK